MTKSETCGDRINPDNYLEPSPYAEDGGEFIGKDPREIPQVVLRQLGGPQSPIDAIRAKCIDCSGGSWAAARKCVSFTSSLWPLRMGVNLFHAKARGGDNPAPGLAKL